MKLTIIGAASPRFPLLLHSLIKRGDIKITELSLYDHDLEKLALLRRTVIAAIERHHKPSFTITVALSLAEAVQGATYIFSSIRVGGQHARMIDEQVPLSFDLIGQETVGVGGFFLALRTIPVVLDQVMVIKEHAPDAWIINFTNPSGLVTQAVRTLAGFDRIIGICDAPELIATHAATIYGVEQERVALRYFGLNHYGWVYSLTVDGQERLTDLITNHLDEFIALEPFYAGMRDHMVETGLIPNEYLYYYLNTRRVVANQKRAKVGRAAQINGLDEALYNGLRASNQLPLDLYNNYIDQRNASYMQIESGYERNIPKRFSLFETDNAHGYDAIALNVLSALQNNQTNPLILNIANDGAFTPLDRVDVIEVSATFQNGEPTACRPAPDLGEGIQSRIALMKRYERQVVKAIATQSDEEAIKALAMHPMVDSDQAAVVYRAMKTAHDAVHSRSDS